MTGEQRRMIYALRDLKEMHWSYAQLAGLFHCTPKTIKQIVEERQWKLSKKGREHTKQRKQILVWKANNIIEGRKCV